jgi:HK97 family phage portal protein
MIYDTEYKGDGTLKKSIILDSRGEEITKSAHVPNFEPSFFNAVFRQGQGAHYTQDPNKPYMAHSHVYSCAYCYCKNISRLKQKLAKRKEITDKEEHIYKHPVLDLFNKPNEWHTRTTFWDNIILSLLLPTLRSPGGQCFIVGENKNGKPVNFSKGEIPVRIYPCDDTLISANVQNGKFINWKYVIRTSAGEIVKYYEPDEIIRIYLTNPYNVTLGLAPFVPARWAAMQDSEADNFNYFHFKNGANITGILSSEQPLNDVQRQSAAKSFTDLYAGSHNAGKVAVFGAGIKFQEIQRSHQDMQFSEMKNINKDVIFEAYGLNELAFGRLKGVPFANVVEGRKILWHESYLPLNDRIWEAINSQWINNIDPVLFGESDLSEVQALNADMGERVKIAAVMVQSLQFPIAEAVRNIGLDINTDKYDWMNDKPETQQGAQALSSEPDKPMGESVKPPIAKAIDDKHYKENRLFSDEYIKTVLQPNERRMKVMFEKHFAKQKKEMNDNVDKWLSQQKDKSAIFDFIVKADQSTNPDASDFLFDKNKNDVELLSKYLPLMKLQMKAEANRLDNELPNGLIQFSVKDENIQAMADLRRDYVKGINTTNFNKAGDKISEAVSQSLEDGLTVNETASAIKSAISDSVDISLNKATTIARTEVGSISSWTRKQAFDAEGIEKWEWVTANDDRVRDSHWDNEGQIVNVGDEFNNGLTMPNDPMGSSENTINCRCVCVYAK